MSAEDAVRFLEAVEGQRNRVALATAYAEGLRAREVTRLKVASIDSMRMLIHVEIGNGVKWTRGCVLAYLEIGKI